MRRSTKLFAAATACTVPVSVSISHYCPHWLFASSYISLLAAMFLSVASGGQEERERSE